MTHHDKEHDRHGFAEGQASEADESAEDAHRGDFAEGQEHEDHDQSDLRRGDFAEGQEREPHDREVTHPHRGDFAEGQELDHDHDPDD